VCRRTVNIQFSNQFTSFQLQKRRKNKHVIHWPRSVCIGKTFPSILSTRTRAQLIKQHCRLVTFPILIHKVKENASYYFKSTCSARSQEDNHRENPTKRSSNMADGMSRVTCPHTLYPNGPAYHKGSLSNAGDDTEVDKHLMRRWGGG